MSAPIATEKAGRAGKEGSLGPIFLLALASVFLLQLAVLGQPASRALAVTVDDLPLGGPRLSIEQMRRVNQSMVEAFARESVPAIGFVNESKLLRDGEVDARIDLLRLWVGANLELGNHTFSHLSLNRVDVEEFIPEIVRGATVSNWLQKDTGRSVRYFRHPYLHTGNTPAKKEGVDRFLAQNGYEIAPVTLDNSDWIFNIVYREAKGRARRRIVEAYLQFNRDMLDFSQETAIRLFGRPIHHVLLLHVNELNADCLPELLELFESSGYRWITLGEALQDPVYARNDTFVGNSGVAWLYRWDWADGLDVNWRTEPVPPSSILKDYDRIQGTNLSGQE